MKKLEKQHKSTKIENSKPVVNPNLIQLISVKLMGATINEQTTETKSFHLKFATTSGFNLDENFCLVKFKVDIVDQENKETVCASFSFDFEFLVENFKEFVVSEEPLLIHGNLGLSLLSIVYSTCRGIILTRTTGTHLNGFILPVIDPAQLIHKN